MYASEVGVWYSLTTGSIGEPVQKVTVAVSVADVEGHSGVGVGVGVGGVGRLL